MKAKHKYNPKNREGARRIAQSYGYKHSIYDDPKMIALLYRAGIVMQGIDYGAEATFVDNKPVVDTDHIADTETIQL